MTVVARKRARVTAKPKTLERSVYEVQAFPSVRVDDPGHNLVGPDWSGLNRANETNTRVSRINEARNLMSCLERVS